MATTIPDVRTEIARKDLPLFLLSTSATVGQIKVTESTTRWIAERAATLPLYANGVKYSRLIDTACTNDIWWLGDAKNQVELFTVLSNGGLRYLIRPSLFPTNPGIIPDSYRHYARAFASFAKDLYKFLNFPEDIRFELSLLNVCGLERVKSPKYYRAKDWSFEEDIRIEGELCVATNLEAQMEKLFREFLFKCRLEDFPE